MDTLETTEEARRYLENFWQPKAGAQVSYRDKPELTCRVVGLCETHPSQAILADREEIAYTQDLQWRPSLTELDEVLESLGIVLLNDGIQLGKTFLPRPTTYIEYAQVIRTFRHYSNMTTRQDPLDRILWKG